MIRYTFALATLGGAAEYHLSRLRLILQDGRMSKSLPAFMMCSPMLSR